MTSSPISSANLQAYGAQVYQPEASAAQVQRPPREREKVAEQDAQVQAAAIKPAPSVNLQGQTVGGTINTTA